MTNLPEQNPLHTLLKRRVHPVHLKMRKKIEEERETRVFGQGVGFFHIENWYSIHAVIRATLRLSFLHERGRRNALKLACTENDISLPHLPEAFDGFKLLHLSDLHLDVNEHMAGALIERISDLDYDICVITGDFRAKTYGPYEHAMAAMKRVRRVLKDPVYSILGNHDSIEMVPGLEGMGIHVMLNESAVIERNGELLYLAGIDDPHYYKAHNLEKAAEAVPEDAVSILLSHSPETYQHAAHAGFDVFFCGHTHGGQICLPGGWPLMCNAKAPRSVCNGAWKYKKMQGYTSKGSGASVVDVRYNCPPEVTVHTLRRAEAVAL
ncbi:MAG TPA: metallophosphoesterase [Gammaproteobacteria bacterium]|nr:metallophosphoesterase [Gammaproteobacteria bacterium]